MRKALDKYTKELDALCDELGISWQPNGTRFRGILWAAMKEAKESGIAEEQALQKRLNCKHDYTYNGDNETCKWCGQTQWIDSSD